MEGFNICKPITITISNKETKYLIWTIASVFIIILSLFIGYQNDAIILNLCAGIAVVLLNILFIHKLFPWDKPTIYTIFTDRFEVRYFSVDPVIYKFNEISKISYKNTRYRKSFVFRYSYKEVRLRRTLSAPMLSSCHDEWEQLCQEIRKRVRFGENTNNRSENGEHKTEEGSNICKPITITISNKENEYVTYASISGFCILFSLVFGLIIGNFFLVFIPVFSVSLLIILLFRLLTPWKKPTIYSIYHDRLEVNYFSGSPTTYKLNEVSKITYKNTRYCKNLKINYIHNHQRVWRIFTAPTLLQCHDEWEQLFEEIRKRVRSGILIIIK